MTAEHLTLNEIMAVAIAFPLREAAEHFGVGWTSLKKRCRRLRLMKWPFRSFCACSRMLHLPQYSEEEKKRVSRYLEDFIRDPTGLDATPKWILVLRQRHYKYVSKNKTAVKASAPERPTPWYLLIDVSKSEFDHF